jgi:hypothetical protein
VTDESRSRGLAKAEVVERLEAILPGLRQHAWERAVASYAKVQELWQRRHPLRPPLGQPPLQETAALSADAILERAEAVGAQVAHIPVAAISELREDVFVVSDDLACEWVNP